MVSGRCLRIKCDSTAVFVVILPHLGSATLKTRSAMAKLAAQNILKALNGEEMLTPVC